MLGFDYRPARSLDEALAILAETGDDGHAIAGGTSLVLMMKQGLVQPGVVVGLGGVLEMQGVRRATDGGLVLGALATHREIETSPEVLAFEPAVAAAFARIATIRIRNQATLGGNLAHADPAQDPPAVLLALDAEVVLASDGATRTMPIAEFFVDYFQTALAEGELIREVHVPALPARAKFVYEKFLPRTEDDYATVAVAACAAVDDDGRCASVRIGLGSLGMTPLRARAVETALTGERLTDAAIDAAAALVRDEIDPIDDVRGSASYKREMARVWTARALKRLSGGR